MAGDKKHFLLRLSPELWQEISRWAADELRSVNGQIEYLLRDAVRRHRRHDVGGVSATEEPDEDSGR